MSVDASEAREAPICDNRSSMLGDLTTGQKHEGATDVARKVTSPKTALQKPKCAKFAT